MQQLHSAGQYGCQNMLCGCTFFGVFFIIQTRFSKLYVPVANLAPDEVVNHAASFAQLELLQHFGNALSGVLQTGQNPFICQGIRSQLSVGIVAFHVHQSETGSVPDFVGKVTGCLNALPVEAHIVARGVAGNQHEAQCIGAVLINNLQRVDAVAQGFGHLTALAVANQTMDEYLVERNLMHEFHTHNQHTCNPEEDDIVTGYEHACRIELLQQRSFIRPAHGRERPQSGAEPGIQCVLVLMDMCAAAFRADSQIGAAGAHFATVIAVPYRNAVAPPNLTGDTPVTDIIHPAGIGFGEAFRYKLSTAVFNAVHSSLNQRLHLNEPLGGNLGFNSMTAALAVAYSMGMLFNLNQIAVSLQVGNNRLTAFLTGHAFVFACFFSHNAVQADNNDARQVVADTHLIVVRIMGRSNFYSTGTKLGINIAVGDNRNNSVGSRQTQGFANQVAITRVLRINCYCSITGQSFRTGGSNHQAAAFFFNYRVVDVPEMARVILMLNLDIAQCGVAVYTPVGDTGAFVNQALFKQSAENLANSLGATLVHSKALTLPVAGNAQVLQLVDDTVAVLLLPFPNAFQELFAAQVITSLAFLFFDNLFNLNLGCQACMVIAGHPQGVVAHHAVPADQDILQGIIQRMAHMQLTGDVRWGDNNTEGFLALFYFGMKITMLFPEFIPFLLYGSRIINLRDIMLFTHKKIPP